MKKTGLLNQPVSCVIAGLGHMDTLVIADAGLPIPATTERIDLAVSAGIPAFLDVLRAVLGEMEVQGALIAEEFKIHSPDVHATLLTVLDGIPVQEVPHETLKHQTGSARAVVRTGEFSPYANVILIAGVVF